MSATVIDFPKLAETVKQEDVCPHCGTTEECGCEEELAMAHWDEFQRFFLGDMREEEGTEYLGSIAFTVILGPDKEPLGVLGETNWGWFDTLHCAAHFKLPDRIQSMPIPELEEWGWDTEGMVESIAEYSITGCSSDGSVSNKPPLKKIVHQTHW